MKKFLSYEYYFEMLAGWFKYQVLLGFSTGYTALQLRPWYHMIE